MFKAIGFLIILWGLSLFLSSSFDAFDAAATETFKAVEAAAVLSQEQIELMKE